MELIDISPLVSERIGVWPGDVAYRRPVSLRVEDGHNFGLSSLATTVHLGAHADAPIHYVAGGRGIHEMPLTHYYGPCQVVEVPVARGARIVPRDVAVALEAPRVLFKSGTFPDPNDFTTDFASLSPELVELVAARGGVLVGIDTPSVDPFDDKELLAHHALARHGMANLEGLVLAHVPAGLYTLIALPLPLEGADASPVRAVLARDQ